MNILVLLLCSLLIANNSLYTMVQDVAQEEIISPEPGISFNTKKNKRSSRKKKTFLFQFENKDLVDVINLIASEKNINIVLPQKPAIDAKLTFHAQEKMTIEQAWNLLYTILDVVGYTIKPQGDMFAIIRTPEQPPALAAEPMPTFIGTAFDDLPDGDVRIRYVHYLANMKVPVPGVGPQKSELEGILEHILPAIDKPLGDKFLMDVNANALILVGKAGNIKGAVAVINQLDKSGFQEKMEIVKLKHTASDTVSKLFIDHILKAATPPGPPMRADLRKPGETYFAPNTRIIPEPRTNALIVVGRAQAVDRIKDFIETYIDLEPDSGRSILHVYTLLYLNAERMVPVLNNIIGTQATEGTGQSTSTRGGGGPERFFDPIIIRSDIPEGIQQQNIENKGGSKYQYSGSNKLIIAARNDDWKRIKNLLEQLDKPFPQVFIEVLIADVNLDDLRQLGQQTRNLNACLPSQINIQSAQLAPPIVDTTIPPGTIAGDLLSTAVSFVNPVPPPARLTTLAGLATPGSTVISFNDDDGQTWSLLQVLRSFGATKIISHPHVVTIDNKEATFVIADTRLVVGEATLGTQAANIKRDPIAAPLKVNITPRISPDNVINLNVDISINRFALINSPGFLNTIDTREVHTNANVRNKSILALGGLISTELDDIESGTPLLSRIPIIGWFFKNRRSRALKENLTVFISPTIIMPNLRGGIHQHAKDYIGLAKQYATEGSLFDSLRDPVTRWFFKTGVPVAELTDEFVKDDPAINGDDAALTESITARRKGPGIKEEKRRARVLANNDGKRSENRAQQLKDVIQGNEINPMLNTSRNQKAAAAA